MSRYYKKNGQQFPSVTTITGQLDKPALVAWAAKMACEYILQELEEVRNWQKDWGVDDIIPIVEASKTNFRKVSQAALNIGSQVHDAIETYLQTGREPFKPSDEVLSSFLAFLEWIDEHEVKPLQTEMAVYGSNYAGTCDLVCTFNGQMYVIDFKTSSGIYPEMRYQIAAYRQALGDKIKGCGILRLPKEEGLPEWKDTSDTYNADLEVFNILTNLWWASHPIKRKQFEMAA